MLVGTAMDMKAREFRLARALLLLWASGLSEFIRDDPNYNRFLQGYGTRRDY
jgi:hypothetical protein